jgi:hypothetical protein
MGRLEVLSKRQEALVAPTVDMNESESEADQGEKIVKIVSTSWRNIINERKQAGNKVSKEPEPEPTGFFLDFGETQEAEIVEKPIKQKEPEIKEKKKKKKEKPKEKLELEDLPRKLQRRIEKRKRRKEE